MDGGSDVSRIMAGSVRGTQRCVCAHIAWLKQQDEEEAGMGLGRGGLEHVMGLAFTASRQQVTAEEAARLSTLGSGGLPGCVMFKLGAQGLGNV